MSADDDAPDRADAPARPGFLNEVRDALAVRTVLLVGGVLLLQLAFIVSYVGAFHAPKPHEIPVAVVAPAPQAEGLVRQLNSLPEDPVRATALDEAEARSRLRRGETSAVLLVDPRGTQDTLLVASGGGTSVVSAVTDIFRQVETKQGRTLAVRDMVPLQDGDARGLTGFYLVVGWLVGGYLVASLLGVARGARPANVQRARIRLLAGVVYSVLSGLGGAIIVGPVLGALTGHFLALWGVGTLLVLSATTVTMALQILFGTIGIGLTVLIFVVLGNPSAGGAFQLDLLPPFWRAIGHALPNGAGTDAVRRIVYFDGHGIRGHLLVIAAYVVGGAVVAMLGAKVAERRTTRTAG